MAGKQGQIVATVVSRGPSSAFQVYDLLVCLSFLEFTNLCQLQVYSTLNPNPQSMLCKATACVVCNTKNHKICSIVFENQSMFVYNVYKSIIYFTYFLQSITFFVNKTVLTKNLCLHHLPPFFTASLQVLAF